MKLHVTRRQIALIIVAAGAATALRVKYSGDATPAKLSLPPIANPDVPSYETFLALSQIVLVRSQLDETLARQIYRVVMDEPWADHHIISTYANLRERALQQTSTGSQSGPLFDFLNAGDRWFVSHLVTTWYLGIYYHEQRDTQRITMDGALMYEVVRDLSPRPYVDSIGYGLWAEPVKIDERHSR